MLKVLFVAVVVVFLFWAGAQAANNCNELTGIISGSMVFENCTIPSGTGLTIRSDSSIKFVNLTATDAVITVGPLNVIVHVLGGMLPMMAGNIFVVDTTDEVRNVTLHAKDVYARGTSSSAFSILTNRVQGATIVLEDCDIAVGDTANDAANDRRGIGALLPSSPTFRIENVVLTALGSVLVVRGHWAVAAMGVAVLQSSPGHGTITSLLAHVVDSDVQVLGSFSVSSIGISVRGDRAAVEITPTNVTMAAHGSKVTTNGSCCVVASLGIAVIGASGAMVTLMPTNVTMSAHGSNVTTSGDRFVASLGILPYCWGSACRSTLAAQDTLITAELSQITATGPNAGIVAMGFGNFGGPSNSIPTTTITNATVIACSSTIISSEVTFDVVARFDRSGSPFRFHQHHPVSVANWSVTILGTTVTTVYAAPHGDCLMALPNATHNGTAPSIIRDSVLNCSGLPTTEPMAPDMLLTSNVTNRTGNEVAFLGANITGGPFEECPIPHHHHPQPLTPTHEPTPSLTPSLTPSATSQPTASESTSRLHSLPPSRTRSASGRANTSSHSQTLSGKTLTTSLARTPTLPLPPPPPPNSSSPTPTTAGSVQLQLLMPQVAADIVAGGASTTAVIGGVANPASASQVARVGGMVRALECAIIQDDPKPSYVEMPLQIDFGGGKYATFAGSLLLTTVVLVSVPFVFHAVWWRCQPERTVVLKVACAVHAVSVEYFVPNALGAAALLMANGDGTEAAIGAMCAAVLLAVVAVVSWRVVALKLDGDSKASITPLFAFVDGARDLDDVRVRVYALEELLVSSLIAVITSVRRGSCESIAILVVVIVVAHLAYLAALRPLRSRLEAGLVTMGALLQLALGLLVAVTLMDGHSSAKDRGIAFMLLAIFAQFFVQTTVLALHHSVRHHKRRREALLKHHQSTLAVPLHVFSPLPDASGGHGAPHAPVSANPLSPPARE